MKAIAEGTFNYTDFFPDSKNAIRFGHKTKVPLISDLIKRYLLQTKNNVKPSTYERYQRVCNTHLLPTFGKMPIKELNSGFLWD